MNQMMTHPIHGTKFANSQKEIESDLLHGWIKYEAPIVIDSNTDDIVAKEVAVEVAVVVENEPVIDEPVVTDNNTNDVVAKEMAVEVAVVVEDEPVIDEPVVDSFLKSLDKKKK